MADTNLGTAVLRTGLDASGLRTGLQQAGQQISGFAQRGERDLARLGQSFTRTGQRLSIGLTAPIVALGALSLRAASDAEETGSKFATVFRDIGDDAERAADRLGASFGLSSTNARRLLGDTGDLLTGFGFTQDAALDLSVSVNELAVDLASFTNFSGGAEGASAALTKALLGETESLKSLGIAIRQTDVEAKVLELTQQGLTFETDRQARAYATLAIAQEQSVNAIGDYARTSESFANQSRGLRQDLNDLQVVIGERLLPTATRIVGALREGVRAFTDLNPVVQTAGLVIGGLAAAAGPLLLVLGQIVTIIPKVTAGLAALRTAGLLAAGPAGWIALGVIAVGGLALSLSGRGDSLDAAVEDASLALSGRNAGELVGALDRVIAQTDGPVRDSFQRLRDDVVETGDVSVEQAERIRAAFATLDIDTRVQAAQARVASLQGLVSGSDISASPARDVDAIFRAANLDRSQFTISGGQIKPVAEGVLEGLNDVQYDAFLRISREWAADTARITGDAERSAAAARELAEAEGALAALNEERAAIAAALATGTGSGGGGGGGAGAGGGGGGAVGELPEAARTVRAVFDELGAAGAASVRRTEALLAAGAGIEAVEADVSTRLSLVTNALDELLTDFLADVTTEELAYLVGRRDFLQGQVDRLRDGVPLAPDASVSVGAIPGTGAIPGVPEAVRIGAAAAAAAQSLTADQIAAAAAIRADTALAQSISNAVVPEAVTLSGALSRAALSADQLADAERIRADTAEAQAASDSAARADLIAARGGGGPSTQGRPGIPVDALAQAQAASDQVVELARDTVVSLINAGAPASEIGTAYARLSTLSTEAARGLQAVVLSLVSLETAATGVQLGAGGAPVSIGPSLTRDLPEGAQRDLAEGAAAARLALATGADDAAVAAREAGQDFALSVAQAGAQFTLSLVDSIRNGDIGGAFQSILSGAGSITGALASFGPAAGLISGAAAGPLGIAAAILPIVGSLIGGLFGGRRQTDTQAQQAEEAQRRQRSTPSIQITANVTQQNTFGTDLVDPRTRAALDSQTRDIVGEVLRQVGFADIRRAALGAPT